MVTISILNADGEIIAEKRIKIEKEKITSQLWAKQSYGIITGSYHDFMQDSDTVNENIINENDDVNGLTAHAAAMEELSMTERFSIYD